ncbi:hypothetical protein SteCoe_24911 [Stentor coeruleus]|uniref:Uncharacterized protein n=1 Tax=Stentor coeruleus TaxID=5963 RepID=A0A1R2BGH3_9CILI|nr:hypothetical protein SteCoe_24911 [Stentor coeruleus]
MNEGRSSTGVGLSKEYSSFNIPKYNPDEFNTILKSSIQISSKNKILQSKANKIKEGLSDFNSEEFDKAARDKLEEYRLKHPHYQFEEDKDQSKTIKLEQFSCLLLFILKGKNLKNMIPDFEFIRFENESAEIVKKVSNNAESLLEIAKLKCYQQNYLKAAEYLNRCLLLSKGDNRYKIWKAAVGIKLAHEIPKNDEKNTFLCCGPRNKATKADYLIKLIEKLNVLPQTIESLWGLMEISLLNIVEEKVYIEPVRYYAMKILEIDNYYGYLAWAYLFYKEWKSEAIDVLIGLTKSFPKRPEAYYLAWEYFFKNKNYENAKDIAAEAFLRVTDTENTHYYILFCLKLAKSYYYTGDFSGCIELLHSKYLEHPNYTVFLYAFSKYCVMSEDFAFTGIAKGNMIDLIRLCDNSRSGSIYYWLCRSYLLTRQFPSAYKYALKSINNLETRDKRKIMEMQKNFFEIKPHIERIIKVQTNIRMGIHDVTFDERYEQIKDFHKPTAEMIKAEKLFSQGNLEKSISTLKIMISTSRLETTAYFKLLEIDPLSAETTFRNLLTRAKNTQIPSQIWVKASLMYAKFLFKSSHFNKSFYVLRVLAKMLPPMPYLHIPYCISLHNADNFQELATAFINIIDNPSPKNQKLEGFYNARDLTTNIIEDAPLPVKPPRQISPKGENLLNPERKFISSGKAYKKFSSLVIDVDLEEVNHKNPPPAPGENRLSGFSVCSKPKFLYYIAKFSLLLKKNKQEALLAISDFKQLLYLEKNKTKCRRLMEKAIGIQKKIECLDF